MGYKHYPLRINRLRYGFVSAVVPSTPDLPLGALPRGSIRMRPGIARLGLRLRRSRRRGRRGTFLRAAHRRRRLRFAHRRRRRRRRGRAIALLVLRLLWARGRIHRRSSGGRGAIDRRRRRSAVGMGRIVGRISLLLCRRQMLRSRRRPVGPPLRRGRLRGRLRRPDRCGGGIATDLGGRSGGIARRGCQAAVLQHALAIGEARRLRTCRG